MNTDLDYLISVCKYIRGNATWNKEKHQHIICSEDWSMFCKQLRYTEKRSKKEKEV